MITSSSNNIRTDPYPVQGHDLLVDTWDSVMILARVKFNLPVVQKQVNKRVIASVAECVSLVHKTDDLDRANGMRVQE